MADKSSEHYELKRIDAKPTKNSGRGQFQKGDGIIYSPSEDACFTVDVKESNISFGLNERVWAKVTTDARQNGTAPLLKVVIGEKEPKTRLIVMSENIYKEMYAAWEQKYYGE